MLSIAYQSHRIFRTPMVRILPDLRVVATTPEPEQSPRSGPGRKPGVGLKLTVEQVRDDVLAGKRNSDIAKEHGCSLGTVARMRALSGLSTTRGKYKPRSEASPLSRHEARPLKARGATLPPFDNAALSEARTVYPSSVIPVEGANNLLIGGVNSWKIGAQITKGRWRGFPIYTLTLEERATCPTSCRHWRSCYGNSMHLAKRLAHGPALEDRLFHELAILQSRYPKGFAVRLHVLGDFYSAHYVALWRAWLDLFPALHVFGFTARHDDGDETATALKALVAEQWPRFAIRFSNAPRSDCSTITLEHPVQKPADAIICPQQLGKTAACATCALCWQSTKRIAFLQH